MYYKGEYTFSMKDIEVDSYIIINMREEPHTRGIFRVKCIEGLDDSIEDALIGVYGSNYLFNKNDIILIKCTQLLNVLKDLGILEKYSGILMTKDFKVKRDFTKKFLDCFKLQGYLNSVGVDALSINTPDIGSINCELTGSIELESLKENIIGLSDMDITLIKMLISNFCLDNSVITSYAKKELQKYVTKHNLNIADVYTNLIILDNTIWFEAKVLNFY